MTVIQTVPSLTDQVYRAVLNEICEGVLAPGSHLVQEQLAERLGVSRQPIQQAITLLKSDGLVEEAGKRGVRVTFLDVAIMRHHYDIRGALDGLAARCSAERIARNRTLARHAEQRGHAIIDAGNRAVATGSIGEQIHHDEVFHRLAYEFSGNSLLARTAEPHWRYLRRTMGEVLRKAAPPGTIWQQHAEILRAILAGSTARAERLALDHVRMASDRLADALQDRE